MSKKSALAATLIAATFVLGTAALTPSFNPTSAPIASGTEVTVNETGEPVIVEPTEPPAEIETPVEPTIEPEPQIIVDPVPPIVNVPVEAPTETETRDEGFPLPEYGDGCRSYDDQPNWIVCPTEAYSADLRVRLTICEQEDSRNCYWDAKRQGNGLGISFVNIEGIIYTATDRSE